MRSSSPVAGPPSLVPPLPAGPPQMRNRGRTGWSIRTASRWQYSNNRPGRCTRNCGTRSGRRRGRRRPMIGKDRRQFARRYSAGLKRFLRDRYGETSRFAASPPFGRGQNVGNRFLGRPRMIGFESCEDCARGGPPVQSRSEDPDRVNIENHYVTFPKIRLQLFPPNPNELLITRVSG
jgi:hypothetical protein